MSKINLYSSFKGVNNLEFIDFNEKLCISVNQDAKLAEAQMVVSALMQQNTMFKTAYDLLESLGKQYKNQEILVANLRSDMEDNDGIVASTVEKVAKGDENYIESFGFVLRAKGTKNTDVPGIPSNVTADTNNEGVINLSWNKPTGAKGYQIDICQDPLDNSKWQHIKSVTTNSATIIGLESGKTYWFRILAMNDNGNGHYCDPISKKVY